MLQLCLEILPLALKLMLRRVVVKDQSLHLKRTLGDLAKTALVLLALLCEHLQLLLQVFECLLDCLLTSVALLVPLFQRRRESFAVFRQGQQLLIFATQCSVKLLYQIVLHL